MEKDSKLIQELYHSIENEIKSLIQKKFSMSNMVGIIKLCIETIENFKGQTLTIDEKTNLCKDLIIFVLNDLYSKKIITEK